MSTAPLGEMGEMGEMGEEAALGLVGDVGATNARFRLVNQKHEWASDLLVLPTTQFNEGADLLRAAHTHFKSPALTQCVLAVAGPVSTDGSSIQVINTGLSFEQASVQAVIGVTPIFHNDFFVQARALPYLSELVQIGGDKGADGVKAILGPGSGLGMATLVPDMAGNLTVLPSEGGHGDLAPGSY